MNKVLFVSFESLPFVKTGGLADVVYALPKSLDRQQFEVRVVMPMFKAVKEKYYDGMKYLDIFMFIVVLSTKKQMYTHILMKE